MEKPKVLFFDVNETLLDLSELKNSVGSILGGREDLVPLWFRMMLHYSLVSTLGNDYKHFGEIGMATLQMMARNQGIYLPRLEAQQALSPIRSLSPHPDVIPGLTILKEKGYRMFTLTNSSFEGVNAQMEYAGLTDFFDDLLSVEAVQRFKPHPEVYQWAASRINLKPQDCMMIAAHGWDVAGAQWTGMHTAFIDRPGQQIYPLTDHPNYIKNDLIQLAHAL